MPRVIDYNPVGAIGNLSAQSGQAEAETRQWQATQAQRQQEIQARAQELAAWEGSGGGGRGPMTPSNGRPTGEVIDNATDTTWDPMNGYRSMVPGQPARERYQDPNTGATLAVTGQQKNQLSALDSTEGGIAQDQRQQAVNKILGINVPQLVDYTDPTSGRVLRLTPEQAAVRESQDRASKTRDQLAHEKMDQQARQFMDSMDFRYRVLDSREQIAMEHLKAVAAHPAASREDHLLTQRYQNEIAQAKASHEDAIVAFKADPYNTQNQDKLKTTADALDKALKEVGGKLDARISALDATPATQAAPAPGTQPASAQQSTNLPQGSGKQLTDQATVKQFLDAAGGDRAKARELAARFGWKF